jgi:tRNA threonylcarbamoyladenosine biosynthesis protein TsaB
MLILTIRTDKPEAEVGLYEDQQQLAYETWHAHRELSVTIHQKISDMLASHSKKLSDLEGIVCFAGPGSFTGLRIGLTVANTLAYALNIPVVATPDPEWLEQGIKRLLEGKPDKIALPLYGAGPNITQPKK